jgi:hypothetical protein
MPYFVTVNKTNMDMMDVEIAIGQMKKNKSPSDDEVTVEMITNAGPLGMQWLYRLMRKIWTENKIPGDWHKGVSTNI